MSNYSSEIIEAARLRVGSVFRHHFKPQDLCENGTITINTCMERGMDSVGYDCSGLVIASLCEVLNLNPQQWPKEYRHLNHLKELEESTDPNEGDILLFYPELTKYSPRGTHMGIFVAEHCVIHASGLSGFVEEGAVKGVFERVGVIPHSTFLSITS